MKKRKDCLRLATTSFCLRCHHPCFSPAEQVPITCKGLELLKFCDWMWCKSLLSFVDYYYLHPHPLLLLPNSVSQSPAAIDVSGWLGSLCFFHPKLTEESSLGKIACFTLFFSRYVCLDLSFPAFLDPQQIQREMTKNLNHLFLQEKERCKCEKCLW